jgi:hypothetical protein
MKRFTLISVGCVLIYVAAFALVHYAPGLRRPAMDGDWHYSDVELLESAEFYAFWPLRQINYGITRTQSRHISERLPLGLPDGLPTVK